MPQPPSTSQGTGRTDSPRLAWGLTGSGHWLRETLDFIFTLDDVDLFLTRAAAEILGNYGYKQDALRERLRIYQDHTASSVPVGFLYDGHYHTLVVGPATSNTVAKCVAGISDTLVTNLYAQAGKCRIPAIVFACDTQPTVITEAPGRTVTLYPRAIDLDNTARLATYALTTVVDDLDALQTAVRQRLSCLSTSCS
ncbi:MAG: flavoprotein [Betaproteobacteria bacterium]|nr:flavoprotein [Betaproteobacteria bacterium]MDE2123488.1 flavoprotein [Betaproteobacteria bacterium]MDE2185421.1 flavoprotein [Betaproteobacteria bacterium]MDE2325569.1 flavoprotein [Betaproteobacteria bacterium]